MSLLSAFAAECAAAGGGLARRRFYKAAYRTTMKTGGEKVTDVDREVEQFIAARIAEKYPEHGFLGEESGAVGDPNLCWVLDPIDGTTNFVHQYPGCAVSLAFCENGKPIAAAVHDIVRNETFSAARGEGAFLDNRRMRVSSVDVFGSSLFIAGGMLDDSLWPLFQSLAQKTDGMRRVGATALDMAFVADGRADIVISGQVRFWDVAAGSLLVREAGGLVADVRDNTSFAFGEKTEYFVAGAPGVFAHYLRALKKHCA